MKKILVTLCFIINYLNCLSDSTNFLKGNYEFRYQFPLAFQTDNLMISILKQTINKKYVINTGLYFMKYNYFNSEPIHVPYIVNGKSYGIINSIRKNRVMTHRLKFQMENDLNIAYTTTRTATNRNTFQSFNSKLSIINYYGPALTIKVYNSLSFTTSIKLGLGYGIPLISQYPNNYDFEKFILDLNNYVGLSLNIK